MSYFLAGLLSLCVGVHGYSSGAPGGQCNQMVPGHRVDPQSATSPYSITLSAEEYSCPDEEITVTINGSSSFKGFLCEPRSNPNAYTTVGTLVAPGDIPTVNKCGTNAALTHTEASDKTALSFVWKSSATKENLYIVCTIVKVKETFWVKETSNMIAYKSGGQCGGSSSGTGTGSGNGTDTGSGRGSGPDSGSESSSSGSKKWMYILYSLIFAYNLTNKS